MSTFEPRQRSGAHRTRRDPTGAIVASLLAVLAVGALVIALYGWRGQDPGDIQAAAGTGTSTVSPPANDPSDATTSAAPTTKPPSKQPTTTTSASRPESADVPEVVVLNQTSRGGLAGRVADRLRGRGFDVAAVGDFTGVVPATTVYFPPGEDAAARRVARALPVEPRTRPRFGNLSTSRLTVVVTDSYPS